MTPGQSAAWRTSPPSDGARRGSAGWSPRGAAVQSPGFNLIELPGDAVGSLPKSSKPLPLRWINEREWVAAMFPIDREIGIERQHNVLLVDLGHPHNARIGERHRSVAVFLMQLEQGGDMLLDAKGDAARTIFEQSEQCILRSREAREQMHRLG